MYVSSYYCICVLRILVCMCPHTTIHNHRITYCIDGKPLDVSHGNIKAGNIKVRSPYTLVAAATMYAARADSKCRLTLNFSGPFRHEQLVKAAFWEPLADIAFKQN